MSCPDSGSDQSFLSLDLAKKLNLVINPVSEASPRFVLASGTVAEAVGSAHVNGKFLRGPGSSSNVWFFMFYVFRKLAVPAIMGLTFLQMTETLTKNRGRLIQQPVDIPQAFRINCVGLPKNLIICTLDQHAACANADSGSDLDLISSRFAKSRALQVRSRIEEVMFADGSLGYTTGVAQASFSVGTTSEDETVGFVANSDALELEFHVLDSLTSDVIVGEDTIKELKIFTDHEISFIPSITSGQSDMNIIRHIRSVHRSASEKAGSVKRWWHRQFGSGPDEGDSIMSSLCTLMKN